MGNMKVRRNCGSQIIPAVRYMTFNLSDEYYYLRMELQACTLYLLSIGAPLVQPGSLAVDP